MLSSSSAMRPGRALPRFPSWVCVVCVSLGKEDRPVALNVNRLDFRFLISAPTACGLFLCTGDSLGQHLAPVRPSKTLLPRLSRAI
jgi:hypothetical protein